MRCNLTSAILISSVLIDFLFLSLALKRNVEEQFIDNFGDNVSEPQYWDKIRTWYFDIKSDPEEGLVRVKKFCENTHRIARGWNRTVDKVILRLRKLNFVNPEYKSRRVDVLSYGIKGVTQDTIHKNFWYKDEGDYGYITDGGTEDCVFYLKLLNCSSMVFNLSRYVCGIQT